MRLMIPRYEDTVRGLPKNGRCIPFSNSELSTLSCLRKHWFAYTEGLKSPGSLAMNIGRAWDLIKDDIYLWWKVEDSPYPEGALKSCVWCGGSGEILGGDLFVREDCARCDGSGHGPLRRVEQLLDSMVEDHDPPLIGPDDAAHNLELLYRMAQGYLLKVEGGPLDTLQIVAVEESVARVVLNPHTGNTYTPDTYLRKTSTGYRLATTADEVAEVKGEVELVKVRWPVYQVMRLDVIARNRQTNAGWVIDCKSTRQPGRFVGLAGVDPQLSGYCWGLEKHAAYYGCTGVAGFMYDIVNTSYQRDPKELKWKPPAVAAMKAQCKEQGIDTKGLRSEGLQNALGIVPGHAGFSLSKTSEGASVPSWRYEAAIERAGLRVQDYEEHLDHLFAEVDPKYYRREPSSIGPVTLQRYAHEVYGKARLLSDVRRRAVRASTVMDLDSSFPRTPVCTIGNRGCSFTGICGQDSREAREHYDAAELLQWKTDQPEEQEDLGF